MITLNQLIKHPRKKKRLKTKSLLYHHPQKKGICLRILTRSPKKPNSALRKIAKIRLSTSKEIIAYIPGEGYAIQEHNYVLIRGGKVQDLPGVRYKIIRGALDASSVKNRRSSRSKYGVKK